MDHTWLFVRRSPSLRSWSASARECALFVRLVCRSSLRKQRVGEEGRLHAQFPKGFGRQKITHRDGKCTPISLLRISSVGCRSC